MLAAGKMPSWLSVLSAIGVGVLNQQARNAVAASPDRCLHIKTVRGSTQAVGVGTTHHTHQHCRLGS